MISLRLLCFAASTIALTNAGFSQDPYYPAMKWREKATDHFIVRTNDTGPDPARSNAEDVWEEVQEILTGLEPDFTKNEFRTPRDEKAAEEAPFRYTVYLVGNGKDFKSIVDLEKERTGFSDTYVRSLMTTRTYKDPFNRYSVLCKADPQNSGGGGETDMTSSFVHSTATRLLTGRARATNLPFWMSAGFGYYIEHKVTRGCRVLYIDFQAYYKNAKDAELVKGGILSPEKPWPSPLRRLCKKDVRVSLEKACNAEVITLSPNESGYIFALTCFLVSTDENREAYRRLVAAVRDGKEVTKELLLITYGYEDDESFEKDWYEFVESSKFK